MLAELTGLNVPTAVLPFVNTALAATACSPKASTSFALPV